MPIKTQSREFDGFFCVTAWHADHGRIAAPGASTRDTHTTRRDLPAAVGGGVALLVICGNFATYSFLGRPT